VKTEKVDCSQCKNKNRSIFCHLEKLDLENLSEHKIMNTFKRGQTLYYQGNPAFGVYCISSGKIKLTRSSDDGKEAILRIAGPGDLIAFQDMLHQSLHEVTATAIEDTQVCFIDRSYIQNLLREKNSCTSELLDQFARELSSMQDRINGLQSKNVRERVAYVLLDLAHRYGVDTQDGLRLGIHLSREEYASMLGIATETFIRELSLLKEEGIIDQEGKAIVILNQNALEQTIS